MLAEYVAIVGVSALTVTLFFGGYHVPWLHADGFRLFGVLLLPLPGLVGGVIVTALQIGAFVVKVIFFCWLVILLRWTVPRFRFDQIMELGWKRLLPVALANVLVTAVVLLAIDHW